MGASLALAIPFSRARGANNDIRATGVVFQCHDMIHINAYL
jgi:hypothetical protein